MCRLDKSKEKTDFVEYKESVLTLTTLVHLFRNIIQALHLICPEVFEPQGRYDSVSSMHSIIYLLFGLNFRFIRIILQLMCIPSFHDTPSSWMGNQSLDQMNTTLLYICIYLINLEQVPKLCGSTRSSILPFDIPVCNPQD